MSAREVNRQWNVSGEGLLDTCISEIVKEAWWHKVGYYSIDILPRYRQDIPKISPRYTQDIPKTSPRYTQDTPKIYPKYPQDTGYRVRYYPIDKGCLTKQSQDNSLAQGFLNAWWWQTYWQPFLLYTCFSQVGFAPWKNPPSQYRVAHLRICKLYLLICKSR